MLMTVMIHWKQVCLSIPIVLNLCDDVDNDCDGDIDEQGGPDTPIWYLDDDSDGYGDLTIPYVACNVPDGYVGNYDDCDDSTSSISNVEEICDEIDNNCDGVIDPTDSINAPMWYRDADGDGYGNNIDILTNCVQPEDYVSNNLDCNDDNDSVYETTNDADCDGVPTNMDCDDGLQDIGRCISCAQIQGTSIDVGDGNYEIELPVVGVLDVYVI